MQREKLLALLMYLQAAATNRDVEREKRDLEVNFWSDAKVEMGIHAWGRDLDGA